MPRPSRVARTSRSATSQTEATTEAPAASQPPARVAVERRAPAAPRAGARRSGRPRRVQLDQLGRPGRVSPGPERREPDLLEAQVRALETAVRVGHEDPVLEAEMDVDRLRRDEREVDRPPPDRQVVADEPPARAHAFGGVRGGLADDTPRSVSAMARMSSAYPSRNASGGSPSSATAAPTSRSRRRSARGP